MEQNKELRTIILMPVKNEGWILAETLKNLSPNVDDIIIADQQSRDDSLEIAKSFSNVHVINNPEEGHSNTVRWLLLEEARKLSDDTKLIVCIDADEMISPEAINLMRLKIKEGEAKKGDVFKFKWIQLWKDIEHYRNDGAWKNSYKNIAFVDYPNLNEYRKDFVINDHTSRVPSTHIGKEIIIPYPLIHFHFLPEERNQLKQAWYKCRELINGKRNAKRINNTYRVTLPNNNIRPCAIEKDWLKDLSIPTDFKNVTGEFHLKEIIQFFDNYGIEFFEELQIWHIANLRNEFIKRTGRKPISKTYPKILVALNGIKNFVRKIFRI